MKTYYFSLILMTAFSFASVAQDKISDAESFIVSPDVVLLGDTLTPSPDMDTTLVRMSNEDAKKSYRDKEIKFIWDKDKDKKDKSDRFNGHWEGIEFGFNGFDKPDYSAYNGVEFMALNQGKSAVFNLNFYELNIGLAKNYVGLVSGMGFSFNSYRFDNPYTIQKGANRTEPVPLDPENLAKTKLAVSYVNVPLLLEFQIPVNHNEGRLFINAGVVGGAKIGSHTKVKYGDDKEKVRGGFNLNSFNYSAAARIGFKDVSLFATYSLTPLFQTGKGPELTPFSIGISFLD